MCVCVTCYNCFFAGSLFSINSTTGVVIVTGSVNYEMGSEYELSVEARDHGNNPQRSQVVALHIQIINAEDESPRFPTSFFTTTVTEGIRVGGREGGVVGVCTCCV